MNDDGSEQLTEAQKECLRLVLTRHSSKEIAGLLGISPSAVDKRLERAVQILRARSRFDAARRLARIEGAYDPLPSERIDVPAPTPPDEAADRERPRRLLRRLIGLDPVGRSAGPVRNPLTGTQRMVVMTGMLLGLTMASLALLGMASSLTRLLSGMGVGTSAHHGRASDAR